MSIVISILQKHFSPIIRVCFPKNTTFGKAVVDETRMYGKLETMGISAAFITREMLIT
jgi:hypothetical protein